MGSLIRQYFSRFMSRGLTPVRLILIVLVLGLAAAFGLNAAVEDKLLLLDALQWVLGDDHQTP